ncbi:MAG: 1-deoxy-D-xylulose-5-phosphate reductoisomerase, partial [Bacteroidales bacterium]|nr:1-deoxy-D-xylulose-5-phosphate reductoisomerase [Bacteroidales bacterium]
MTVNGCKKIAIIGSTGSIGQQALEVIRSNRPMFDVYLLSAHSNHELLARQVLEFSPGQVVIGQKTHYRHLKKLLPDTQVYAGSHYLHDPSLIAEADLVLNAMVGIDGLKVGLNALKQGKNLAMANKESLVAAGSILMQTARENRALVIPVDSEHSAVFQCLHGEETGSVEKVYLTASGGPFRGMKRQDLHAVSIGEALKHPNWRMGTKVSIDSATLMNKGMEAIATQWLFGLKPEQIHILFHPQSIIHSLVQFADGSIKAQLAMPDMKIPLQYALAYP